MLLLTLLAVVLAKCDHSDFKTCTGTTAPSFNFIMLTQTWPGNFCSDGCCITPTKKCGLNEGFTLHGFWPQYEGTSYPSCCKRSYSDDEIEDMITSDEALWTDIATYWPSMKKCNFVTYEWAKHGTCAENVYASPKEYMRAALDLRKNHDMWAVFKANGVVADGKTKYDVSWLRELTKSEYGGRGYFTCSSQNRVSELRVCFEVNSANKMNPTAFDCPDALVSTGGCASSVYFDKFPTVSTCGPCTF